MSPKSVLGLNFNMVVQILTSQCCSSLTLHKPCRAPSFLGGLQFLIQLLSRTVGRLALNFISCYCFGIFGHWYGGKEVEKLWKSPEYGDCIMRDMLVEEVLRW